MNPTYLAIQTEKVPRPFESTIQFHKNHFHVRLFSDVDTESIYRLCDLIDLGFDYYRYPEVEICINSPGGSVDAMHMFLERLSEWRTRKLIIGTKTDALACSAAAVIMALGSLGKRFARERSTIVFHFSRVPGIQNATASMAQSLGESLMATDKEMIEIVADHVLRGKKSIKLDLPKKDGGLVALADLAENEHAKSVKTFILEKFKPFEPDLIFTKSEYASLLEKLFDLDTPISPFFAKFLGLVDQVTDAAGQTAEFKIKSAQTIQNTLEGKE